MGTKGMTKEKLNKYSKEVLIRYILENRYQCAPMMDINTIAHQVAWEKDSREFERLVELQKNATGSEFWRIQDKISVILKRGDKMCSLG
jgi:hypothetical protein